METASTPGSVGDYAGANGTTGSDEEWAYALPPGYVPGTKTQPIKIPVPPPTGAMPAFRGLSLENAFPDGTSHTILIGEKHVPKGWFGSFPYDCNVYSGHIGMCHSRSAGPTFPLATDPDDLRVVFGSAHPGVVQFAFADGGVRQVRKSVSEFTLGQLAHRADGLPAPVDY